MASDQSRERLLAVLTVALLLAIASCVSEEDVKDKAGEVAEQTKESMESWADWAKGKISEAFSNGGGGDDAIKESGKLSGATEQLRSVASGGGEQVAQEGHQAGEVKDKVKHGAEL